MTEYNYLCIIFRLQAAALKASDKNNPTVATRMFNLKWRWVEQHEKRFGIPHRLFGYSRPLSFIPGPTHTHDDDIPF